MEEIVATHRSLVADQNNRVEDTDAVDRVHALGDMIDNRSTLLRLVFRNPTRNYGDPSRGPIHRLIDLI